MKRICHLTSVHSWNDVRIFHKECCSLAKAGFEVHFVVPNAVSEKINDIHILGVPRGSSGRFSRMSKTVYAIYRAARAIDAELYHIHDPELLPLGLLLKIRGKRVIYDAHEDLPRQLLSKPWIPLLIRKPLSWLCELVENALARRLDVVVTATSHIEARFNRAGCRALAINNYPRLDEFEVSESDGEKKERAVCYVGGITGVRGIREMVTAIGLTDAKLLLAGTFSTIALRNEMTALPGWNSVEEFGYVDRGKVSNIINRSSAGLVVLHPIKNYLDSLPIKMFEYMAAGVPVLASNFPLWKEIIEGNGCGLCVDPLNPVAIAEAIDYLVTHPQEAEQMGRKGQKAVANKYNWAVEEKKLLEFYHSLTD